ncbi:MAG: macro domain-containing protein [Acutalibacteraceae bacterium]
MEPTGSAKITKSYNLPCEYVIHTVGPIISGYPTHEDCSLLSSCYSSCLELARNNRLHSISFCCISTGEFHFPNDKAAEIAVKTVKNYLSVNKEMKVVFNVFRDRDLKIYQQLLLH